MKEFVPRGICVPHPIPRWIHQSKMAITFVKSIFSICSLSTLPEMSTTMATSNGYWQSVCFWQWRKLLFKYLNLQKMWKDYLESTSKGRYLCFAFLGNAVNWWSTGVNPCVVDLNQKLCTLHLLFQYSPCWQKIPALRSGQVQVNCLAGLNGTLFKFLVSNPSTHWPPLRHGLLIHTASSIK